MFYAAKIPPNLPIHGHTDEYWSAELDRDTSDGNALLALIPPSPNTHVGSSAHLGEARASKKKGGSTPPGDTAG